jgi:hypothetical protein
VEQISIAARHMSEKQSILKSKNKFCAKMEISSRAISCTKVVRKGCAATVIHEVDDRQRRGSQCRIEMLRLTSQQLATDS